MRKSGLSKRILVNLVLFGFMGQIAWNMENIYFNTFLFNYIGGTTKDISRMVALSAATAVITTFAMGALSDKLGRRKGFICFGYILWGLTVVSFAFISRDSVAALFGLTDKAGIIAATVSVVIIMDCVMTFMGSTANDAAFNAWVTEVTVPENRGTAEGILAVLPTLAMFAVTIGFGAGVASLGYPVCFAALGAGVSLCGVIGLFTIKESGTSEKKQGSFLNDLIYGFRPSVVKKHGRLYLTLVCVCIFGVAVQIFFPYIMIYIQHYLGLDINNLNITPVTAVLAVVVLAGFIAVTVGLGVLVDKIGKARFVYPAVFVFAVGLISAGLAKTLGTFAVSAAIFFAGYGLLMIILNAAVRDFTPEDKVGLFQGVRMIFFVLIPMIVGPFLGNLVIKIFSDNHAAGTYLNDFDEVVTVPVPEMFIAAAIFGLLILLPLFFVKRGYSDKKVR